MSSKVDHNFPLRAERLPSGDRKLIDPLKVTGLRTRLSREVKAEGGEVPQGTVFVDAGFETDYSSIPEKLHWFVRWSKVDIAGVVHDFLYRNTDCPRIEADAIWRELAQSGEHCAGRFQGWVCWVMLCGFGGWSKPYPHEYNIKKTIGAVFLALGLLLHPQNIVLFSDTGNASLKRSQHLVPLHSIARASISPLLLSLWLVNLAVDIPDGICLLCNL